MVKMSHHQLRPLPTQVPSQPFLTVTGIRKLSDDVLLLVMASVPASFSSKGSPHMEDWTGVSGPACPFPSLTFLPEEVSRESPKFLLRKMYE